MSRLSVMMLSIAAGVCMLFSSLGYAEADYEGNVIKNITVEGTEKTSADEVLSVMITKPGDTYNQQQLNEDLKKINELGYFYYAAVKVDQRGDEVAITIVVVEKPRVAKITFTGNDSFSKDRLENQLGIHTGDFVDPDTLDKAPKTLQDFYISEGYNAATVTLERTKTEEGETLAFVIDEGKKVRIKEIQLEGNESFPDAALLNIMQTKAYVWVLSDINLAPAGYYDPVILARDVENLTTFYRNEGYFDVVITSSVEPTEDGKWLIVTVTIVEGTPWTIEEINIEGNDAFTEEEIRDVIKTAPGDRYRRADILADDDRILTLYGDKGYIRAQVVPSTSFVVESKQVIILYSIDEDRPYYVERIEIVGNYKTKDKVIRRELSFYPGQLFNRSEIRKSIQRLRNLGHFETIDIHQVEGSQEDFRNVILEVGEGKTAYLMFGFGVSSNYGFVGNIALVQRNFDIADIPKNFDDFFNGTSFVGAGQYLRFEAMPGTEYSTFRIDFQEPWLFDEPVFFGTSLFAYDRARERYDESRVGGSLSLGRRFMRNLSVIGKVRGEIIDIDDVQDDAPDDVKLVEGSNNVNAIGLTVTYNKIDREQFMIPYDGYELSGTLELGGGLMGGDFDFVRGTASVTKHIPIVNEETTKQVLSLNGQIGAVEEVFDSDFVPVFERFYAGGFGSVRGFEYRTVGPKQNDDPVGGKVLMLANMEYSFPLLEENIRGLVFWDVGSVYSDFDSVDFDKLRSSVGFGFRFYTPLFGPIPISLDFGFPIAKEDDDETQIFNFNIGATF